MLYLELDSWVTTRSYIDGYVSTTPSRSPPPLYHDEKHWSVLMRRRKTPQNEYKPKHSFAPLTSHSFLASSFRNI